MIKRAVLTLAAISVLSAQSRVQGPSVGWIYDPAAGSLRAVLGVPGSSTLGRNLDFGVALSRAVVAPHGNAAIASASEDGRMLLLDLRNGGHVPVEIPDSTVSADDVVFSPSGSAALLVYRNAGKIAVIGGLPAAVTTFREIDFSGSVPDVLAVADDAKLILTSDSGQVMALDGDGNRWNLNFNGSARSISFVAQTNDALLANERGLWLVRNVAANTESTLVWEGNARQALTLNRRSALVLDDSQTLVAVDLDSGAGRRIECSCEPVMLARMSESVIRVNQLSGGPLWLVDWNGQEPRAVFVPADVKSEQ